VTYRQVSHNDGIGQVAVRQLLAKNRAKLSSGNRLSTVRTAPYSMHFALDCRARDMILAITNIIHDLFEGPSVVHSGHSGDSNQQSFLGPNWLMRLGLDGGIATCHRRGGRRGR